MATCQQLEPFLKNKNLIKHLLLKNHPYSLLPKAGVGKLCPAHQANSVPSSVL